MTNSDPVKSINASQALRISVFEGSFAQVHINLTAGMFLTSFALYLGLNNVGIGFLSAIPAFFTAFAFFSIYLSRFLKSRRRLCVLSSSIGRGVFLIFGLLLLFRISISNELFFALIIIHNILMSLAGNAWLTWMSSIVPKDRRGRYFALRNTILNVIGMIVNVAGGKILDTFKAMGDVAKGLGILFTGASISSTVAAGILSQQPEPRDDMTPPDIRVLVMTALRDKNFRKLLFFVSFWYLLGGMAGPFFLVHMLTNLKMSYSTVAIYSIVAGSSSFIFQIIWGKAIDRFKAKPVLMINYTLSACLPLFWLFATPNFLLPIWLDSFLTGIFWTGINLSLFNIILSLTEDKKLKEGYFATFASITGIFAFVASLTGGLVAQLLTSVHIHLLGLTFVNYHFLFVFTSLVRLSSGTLLARVEEKKAIPAIKALQLLGDYTLRRLQIYRGLVLNTVRFKK
jgi:MFS family permease